MQGLTFHYKAFAPLPWLTLCALVATANVGQAAEASSWVNGKHSAARLIGGGQVDGPSSPSYRAGIQIKLSPGWKTYWRYPGDTGVPPRFDFAGSRNLKAAEVLWPAPTRFADAGGFSVGYKEGVVFPLRITPTDPKQPVSIKLTLDYAICEKLCIPAEAKLNLDLDKHTSAHDPILLASERSVPRHTSLGDHSALAVRTVHVDRKDRPRVTVTIAVPKGATADLFAEGPASNWSLPLPEPVGDQSGTLRQFTFDLDGLPPGASMAGAVLRLTAVADETAVEVTAPLD